MDHKSKMDISDEIDMVELKLSQLPQLQVPTIHRFTEGMYIREVHVPAGAMFTSRTHLTQHPFVISKGSCLVKDQSGRIVRLVAAHTGITEPGTRRVFYVEQDMVLTTFHVTEITDPDEWVDAKTDSTNRNLPMDFQQACYGRNQRWLR